MNTQRSGAEERQRHELPEHYELRAPELTSPPFPSEETPRPLTGGAVMSATSRIVVAGTGAVATIVIARLLGPSGSGAYAVAQTLIIMLTVATTLGVEHGIAYYVSSGRWSARHANRTSQLVALVCGIVGVGIGVVVRLAVPSAFNGLSFAVTIAAAAALPFSLSWFYSSYVALAIDNYESYALPPAIQSSAAVCLVALLGALYGVAGAVVGFTLAHVLAAATMLLVNRRTFAAPSGSARSGSPPAESAATQSASAESAPPGTTATGSAPAGGPETSDEPGQLRRAVGFGLKGYASNALQFVNYRLDLFILNATATGAAVGHYSVAIAVTGVMWLLPQALSDVLFPRVAALSARSGIAREQERAFVEIKSLRHTVLITVLSTLVLALALVLLVVPVYGSAFRPAIDLGLILLPGVALLGLTGPLSATILGRGHPGLSLIGAAIVTPLTVVLYVLLIPSLQATGAALASTISYSTTFLLAAFFYRRATGHGALALMLPTRGELQDYRALGPAVSGWLAKLRASTRQGRSSPPSS
jgi:O-antigen/teichoic acid export membrane protein